MKVVSDSTILIGLAKIDKLFLLQELFSEVSIPQAVFEEVVTNAPTKPGAATVKTCPWIQTAPIKDRMQVHLLMASLEQGEAEVLTLAKELHADIVLVDEEKARKSAVLAGFKVMGLLGVLIAAKNLGLLTEIRPVIEQLQRERFRLSQKIIHETLKKAGE